MLVVLLDRRAMIAPGIRSRRLIAGGGVRLIWIQMLLVAESGEGGERRE